MLAAYVESLQADNGLLLNIARTATFRDDRYLPGDTETMISRFGYRHEGPQIEEEDLQSFLEQILEAERKDTENGPIEVDAT